MPSILKFWLPPLLWALAISLFSTNSFSSDQTSQFFVPMFQWVFPSASAEVLLRMHFAVRKLAHLSEYFLLAILLYRAFREDTSFVWQSRWAICTLAVAFLYALIDELHQSFVPSRTASIGDSLIDFLGAGCAMALIYARHRVHSGAAPEVVQSEGVTTKVGRE